MIDLPACRAALQSAANAYTLKAAQYFVKLAISHLQPDPKPPDVTDTFERDPNLNYPGKDPDFVFPEENE